MDAQLAREIQAAYEVQDRENTIANFKVACILGMVLMPAGVVLDYFVCRSHIWNFLVLRLISSCLIAVFLAFLLTPLGRKLYRICGVILLMLPTFFMSYMIYQTTGAESPYYAGLNLVVLMLGFVLHWTFRESLVAVVLVVGMYLTACLLHGGALNTGIFVNNLYFLTLTGIIVVTGSYFLGQLRYRDFANRYELDRNRQQLEENNRKLLELDQQKSRFFANISHELRTPLALILGPLDDLMTTRQEWTLATARSKLEMMRNNGLRLMKLINDLLELVRLDAGVIPVKQEPVDMAELIQGLAASAQHLAEKRQLALETQVAGEIGRVMVDRDKLEKILLNLQFNALKFTPPGGRVTLTATRESEELVIKVTDTGVGIAAKDLPNVFSRFWQADNANQRKLKGVGIGLALVKELTEVQGGSVSVDSIEGQGTTFTVRLPFVAASAQNSIPAADGERPTEIAEANGESQHEWLSTLYRQAEMATEILPLPSAPEALTMAAPGEKPLVLIADDEPDLRQFLTQQLEKYYRVKAVADGRQAVESVRTQPPDLLLLDMMMPEMDGLEVCRALRQQPATRTLPIILLTARADEQTKLSALADGATDFLPKPFSITELNLRVRNLMTLHLHEKELASQKQQLEAALQQLKEAEAQLVQAEKLAALGRMSAGIIHEINNPLNYVTTGLYSLRQQVGGMTSDARAPMETLIAEIEDGLKRVMNIVRDLRPFAGDRDNACVQMDVQNAVNLALRFISHEYKDTVQMHVEVPPGLSAWANRVRFVQVLVNLLHNSLDALKEKPPVGAPPAIWIRGWADQGRCHLCLRDNGPGISPDIQAKVFEPFFTTKDVGAGIGLGLHICHRIMQQHGGRILLRSEPGQYCEFTLEFPFDDRAANAAFNLDTP